MGSAAGLKPALSIETLATRLWIALEKQGITVSQEGKNRHSQQTWLVFESPVRSGFFDPKGGNRGPNRLYLINITMQPKTGLV
jgi:hypothetical protein